MGPAVPHTRLLNSLIYAEPRAAAAVARNIRSMHTKIKGTKADGTKYHALEPVAYAWVHATLFDSITRWHKYFGNPLRRDQSSSSGSSGAASAGCSACATSDLPATSGASTTTSTRR